MTTPARRGEAGQVTAFVTIFVVALLFVIGLVVDGGDVLTARRQAHDHAAQAARAGAQAIDLDAFRRDGTDRLDAPAAVAAARAHLQRVGSTGTARVVDDRVVVEVTIERRLTILAGGSVTVTGTASSEGVQGVTGELPG